MKYTPQLDGLRALAALLVVLFHAKIPGFGAGFFGVDIFFVLSGYLITRLLDREITNTGRLDYAGFCGRRLLRLYPALLAMLAVYLVAAPVLLPAIPATKHLQDAAISSIYMADTSIAAGLKLDVLGHTWSLGVEEKFYLVWPPALVFILQLPRASAIKTVWLLFLVATIWRIWNTTHLVNHWDIYYRFDTHVTGLLLGAALGLAKAELPPWCGYVGAAALVACLGIFDWKGQYAAMVGFTAIEVTAALIVCSKPAWLSHPALAWLGRMSYGFYLWHYLFIKACRAHDLSNLQTLAIAMAGGLACAVISYYTVEAVFRARRRVPTAYTQQV